MLGRERRCRLAKLGEVFLKQQSPTRRKGGEAPGGLEGAVAELFFRPENAPLRGEACCPCAAARSRETRWREPVAAASLLRALRHCKGCPCYYY